MNRDELLTKLAMKKLFWKEKLAYVTSAFFVWGSFSFMTAKVSPTEWSTSARVFAFLFWFFLMLCWASRYYKDKINEQG